VLQAFRAQVDQRLLLHTAGLSALYCGNNQLAFALFRWADAATVTLIKSSSSIVSALLLWLLLDRPIATLQWHAIVLQVLGLFIVQYDDCKHAVLLSLPIYLALFCSLFISSLAGVWNEHVLKTFKVTVHVQNCCLYGFGVLMNLFVFVSEELGGPTSLASAYFTGYNAAAIGVIACQAVLGLVVTAVLKYADVVIRSLATACSISVLYAINVSFLGWKLNLTYLAGCAVVFTSTYLYMALGLQATALAAATKPAAAEAHVDHNTLKEAEEKPPVQTAAPLGHLRAMVAAWSKDGGTGITAILLLSFICSYALFASHDWAQNSE